MNYATQSREPYPWYQHERIGYNYRLSNISACIGQGQMTIAEEHIAHHRHVQERYRELFSGVEGISLHENPVPEFDSNFWLCAITLSPGPELKKQTPAENPRPCVAISSGITSRAATFGSPCISSPCFQNARRM